MLDDNKKNIIFLDFDGVINGNSLKRGLFFVACKQLHIMKFHNFIYRLFRIEDLYDTHEKKVKILSEICERTNASVVITSSWRQKFYNVYSTYRFNIDKLRTEEKNIDNNLARTVELFVKYNIPVIGITNVVSMNDNREDQILNWLSNHEEEIKRFIILDDEWKHLLVFFGNELVLTNDSTPGNNIQGRWYCREGLRKKHINICIDKLTKNVNLL